MQKTLARLARRSKAGAGLALAGPPWRLPARPVTP